MRYNAFLSYSHAADGKLAPALQTALQRFAKPWYRPRALRVFRDQSSLAATPELWPTIQAALDSAGHFLLLASPEAARSRWVRREVDHWLATKPSGHLLIVLTGGDLVWDDAAGDFDWDKTDALPPELRGAFASEPLWVDLRWARGEEHLSLKQPRFLEAVGDLAAPLHGRSKEDLLGEDVRQHKRTMRLAAGAAATLAVLLVAAVLAAVMALRQSHAAEAARSVAEAETARAEREAQTSLSRQLAAQSRSSSDPALGMLLAAEAYGLNPDDRQARRSLLAAVHDQPQLVTLLHGHQGSVHTLAFSPDGETLASGAEDGTVRLWHPRQGKESATPMTMPPTGWSTVVFDAGGQRLATGDVEGTLQLWNPATGAVVGPAMRSEHGAVQAIAVSPDGTRLASTGQDGTIEIWDLATGQAVQPPVAAHEGTIFSLVFSPDGARLISAGGADDTVRIWDAATMRPLPASITADQDFVNQALFSPDGAMLATAGGNGTLRLWDAATLAPIGSPLTGHQGGIFAIAFSADGDRLASGGADGTVRQWDVATRQPLGAPLAADRGVVFAVAYSPDGSTLVSAGQDATIHLWQAGRRPTEALESAAGHDGDLGQSFTSMPLAFSPDGSRIATGGAEGAVILWDLENGLQVGSPLRGHAGRVNDLAFSPDGTMLASASDDGTAQLWSAASGEPLGPPLIANGSLYGVAFNPAGGLLATAGMTELRLWDLGTRESTALPMTGTSGGFLYVSFNRDGTLLAASGLGDKIQIWDVQQRQLLPIAPILTNGRTWLVARFVGDETLASAGDDATIRFWNARTGLPEPTLPDIAVDAQVTDLAANASGTRLASTVLLGDIQIWDVGGNTNESVQVGTTAVQKTVFSPDGDRLAFISSDAANQASVNLWDMERGEIVSTFPILKLLIDAALSPDGSRIVTGGEDGRVIVWDAATGQHLGEQRVPNEGGIWSVAFSPDGARIAVGTGGGEVRIGPGTASSRLGDPLPGHGKGVMGLAFSPDGTQLAAGDEVGRVQIWALRGGKKVKKPVTLDAAAQVRMLAFNADGSILAVAGQDGTIRRWDIARQQFLDAPLENYFGSIEALTFSPDGRFIAWGDWKGQVRLGDLASGRSFAAVADGDTFAITQLAFSADGSLLFAADANGAIQVWTVTADGAAALGTLRVAGSPIDAITLSGDGTELTAVDHLGAVGHWNLSTASWLQLACREANRNLSREEWQTYIGDPEDPKRPYHRTCPALPEPANSPLATPVSEEMTAAAAATPLPEGAK